MAEKYIATGIFKQLFNVVFILIYRIILIPSCTGINFNIIGTRRMT